MFGRRLKVRCYIVVVCLQKYVFCNCLYLFWTHSIFVFVLPKSVCIDSKSSPNFFYAVKAVVFFANEKLGALLTACAVEEHGNTSVEQLKKEETLPQFLLFIPESERPLSVGNTSFSPVGRGGENRPRRNGEKKTGNRFSARQKTILYVGL